MTEVPSFHFYKSNVKKKSGGEPKWGPFKPQNSGWGSLSQNKEQDSKLNKLSLWWTPHMACFSHFCHGWVRPGSKAGSPQPTRTSIYWGRPLCAAWELSLLGQPCTPTPGPQTRRSLFVLMELLQYKRHRGGPRGKDAWALGELVRHTHGDKLEEG